MAESDDDSGWLTYSEAAELLGTTPEAVRTRARRYRWPRLSPNLPGGHARVKLPVLPGTARPRPPLPDGRSPMPDGQVTASPPDTARVSGDHDRAVAMAIAALQEANAALRQQLDRAEVRNAEQAETIRDLRVRLDASEEERRHEVEERRRAQERLAGLLTHRQTSSVPSVSVTVPRVPWWRRWLR